VNDSRRHGFFSFWAINQESIHHCGKSKRSPGKGNVIRSAKDILADLLTPAAAFLRVAHGRRRAYLLESVEGASASARYSFLGWTLFW